MYKTATLQAEDDYGMQLGQSAFGDQLKPDCKWVCEVLEKSHHVHLGQHLGHEHAVKLDVFAYNAETILHCGSLPGR